MGFATETYILRGMRQDDSDLLMNSGDSSLSFAFENYNMRFVPDGSGTLLVATQEKGNEQKDIRLTDIFFIDGSGFQTNYSVTLETLPFRVLGQCVVDKYLVLFGKCLEDTTIESGLSTGYRIVFTTGEDVVVRLEETHGEIRGWLLYHGMELGLDPSHPVETTPYVESELSKKVYFVDGLHQPRVVNVVNADTGLISNINIGYRLTLKDELSVSVNRDVAGRYPMGKVRFFYTYFNSIYAESPIVDWSPFFDCGLTHSGGSPDNTTVVTNYCFRLRIDNIDTNFSFIRIYLQHFTSPDPSRYTLKYLEYNIPANSTYFEQNIVFDDYAFKDCDITYLDMRKDTGVMIPYTMAVKDNRMFYGNIKTATPDTGDVSFAGLADILFKHKKIGHENLRADEMYQYDSALTTFSGSNFDYMGFRFGNWYRFGIIAQHMSGAWSDVIFICDKRCDIRSKTAVRYDDNRPDRSEYYIPQATLVPNSSDGGLAFNTELQKLRNLGFVRVKPVVVTPPVGRRDVITQGIACPTVYTGYDRKNIQTTSRFSIPSWFFRPLPLKDVGGTLEGLGGNDYIFKTNYAYTIRDVWDQRIEGNIKDGNGNWLMNPRFTNERLATYNTPFREYRHGFSLPPKDRINAELESSDFSIHDWYYLNNDANNDYMGDCSNIFSDDGVNLFGFFENGYSQMYFQHYYNADFNYQTDINWSRTSQHYVYNLTQAYHALPYHDVFTTGYSDTVFVDTSICTINSPETDISYSGDVAPDIKDCGIKVVGYSQVTSSAAGIDIDDRDTFRDGHTGKCLFNVSEGALDSDTNNYIGRFNKRHPLPNQPLPFMSGPWWLDGLPVADFKEIKYSDPSTEDIFKNSWSNSLFETSGGTNLDINNKPRYFCRSVLSKKNEPKWTRSFFGELDIQHGGQQVVFQGSATYTFANRRMVVFTDMEDLSLLDIKKLDENDIGDEDLCVQASTLALFPLTLNTLSLSRGISDDVYWQNFLANRTQRAGSGLEYYIDSDNNMSIAAGDYDDYLDGVVHPGDPVWTLRNYSIQQPVDTDTFDFRGLFSYYFFPYYYENENTTDMDVYYRQNHNSYNWLSEWRRVRHPWLLPMTERHNWADDAPALYYNFAYHNGDIGGITRFDIVGMHSDDIPYDEGSVFGCHYYAPFSTNFTGSYFEPYYAHCVYPFMHTDPGVPFCGSRSNYLRNGDNSRYTRPDGNRFHSHLYSCCTNFFNTDTPTFAGDTYCAYYNSPNLTGQSFPEPDLGAPFLGNTHNYSYHIGDSSDVPIVPTITHRTETLTAAMKWYRGFKCLASDENKADTREIQLISPGVYLDKSSIMGNLFFSGMMPQFFKKSGKLNHFDNFGEMHDWYENDNDVVNTLHTFLNTSEQSFNVDHNASPHLVFCNMPDNNTLELLPMLTSSADTQDYTVIFPTDDYYEFRPQFYYKEFVGAVIDMPTLDNDNINNPNATTFRWRISTYPHTGVFQQYFFPSLRKADQPYWNKDGVLSGYPSSFSQPLVEVDMSDKSKTVQYDFDGNERDISNYWMLPVCDVYNRKLIENYGAMNPYTYRNDSVEVWDWKMCGETVSIDNLAFNPNLRYDNLHYREGDTYFQRYNCLKSVSNDTVATEPESIGYPYNDVTETASVMIESYFNIDGTYGSWDRTNLQLPNSSPLLNPLYNHINMWNPAYSIQNGICDVFKQVDTNYVGRTLRDFPTMIMWSAKKQDGEENDSFGLVPPLNRTLTDGTYGYVNKLLSFGDNIFCLQSHALSVLDWNTRVIQPTTAEGTLSVFLSDSTKLNGITYISRTAGTDNKWSVASGRSGFYWADGSLGRIYGYISRDGSSAVADITEAYGLKSWSSRALKECEERWDADTFPDGRMAFKACTDIESGDIYWMNGEECISYNEQFGCFTSFYGYDSIPYKFLWEGGKWSLKSGESGTQLWHDQCVTTHTLYGEEAESYIDILSNPSGLYDKVFNFIEYNAEAYADGSGTIIERFNPWNRISVSNMYQKGEDSLSRLNTKDKFRLWRTSLPREIMADGTRTLNRIRGPWCRIRLSHVEGGHLSNIHPDNYTDKLYYINVNYTFPDQPLKTNIRR